MRRIARFFSVLLIAVFLCSSALADQHYTLENGMSLTFPDGFLVDYMDADVLAAVGETSGEDGQDRMAYVFMAAANQDVGGSTLEFSAEIHDSYALLMSDMLKIAFGFDSIRLSSYENEQAEYLIFAAQIGNEPMVLGLTEALDRTILYTVMPVSSISSSGYAPVTDEQCRAAQEILIDRMKVHLDGVVYPAEAL